MRFFEPRRNPFHVVRFLHGNFANGDFVGNGLNTAAQHCTADDKRRVQTVRKFFSFRHSHRAWQRAQPHVDTRDSQNGDNDAALQTTRAGARLTHSCSFSIPRRPLTTSKIPHQTSFNIDGFACASMVHLRTER
jgi:hypothetical protein